MADLRDLAAGFQRRLTSAGAPCSVFPVIGKYPNVEEWASAQDAPVIHGSPEQW